MITAICFFMVGALAGAFMVFRHLKKRRLPGWVAIGHGLAGATGFGLLTLFCFREPAVAPARIALGILVGAIVLGCVNVVYHLRGVRHRFVLIAAHALVAVSGVGTLAYAIVTHVKPHATIAPVPAAPEPVLAPVPVAKESPAPTPAEPAMDTRRATALGRAWTDLHVRFDYNRGRATPSSQTSLATIAQALADDPSIELVEVQGHADERGADDMNLALTRQRAKDVVDALVALGVAPGRLRSTGYGSRCPAREECRAPIAPPSCHSEDALREDRRVTFVIVRSGGQELASPGACGG